MSRYVDCKRGVHQYSTTREIGGGIGRRICQECGLVQIDLTEGVSFGETDLFTEPKLATMFQVEALLARVSEELVGSSFGVAPSSRRRPAQAFG